MQKIGQKIDQVERKFSLDSYVRGFHVYKGVWSTLLGEEELRCFHKKENKTYELVIAV